MRMIKTLDVLLSDGLLSCLYLLFFQEVYISKVKALLGKELHLENGNSNGYTNGSHKDEDGEEASMDVQEEEETMKSPTASKGKGGRRSKTNSDTKS